MTGSISQAQRADEIERFHCNSCCFVLLLTVGACATGLNLTVADHCFLVEPQANVGKEVQLCASAESNQLSPAIQGHAPCN